MASPIIRYRVLLVTSWAYPEGEPGIRQLQDSLLGRGIDSHLVVWNDPTIGWDGADLIVIRSTWDYQDQLDDFLSWTSQHTSKLVHGFGTINWNTRKSYLIDLGAAGVPIVPSLFARDTCNRPYLVTFEAPYVCKPVVGASGGGVQMVASLGEWKPTHPGPWLIQPFITSIFDEGETTVFVIGGNVTGQLRKIPAASQFLVHEEYGGRTIIVPISAEANNLAQLALRAVENLLDIEVKFARIDMLRYQGRLVVSEVELTEPGMSFDIIPGQVEHFAAMIQACCYQRNGDQHTKPVSLI